MGDFIVKAEIVNSRDWIEIIISAAIPVVIMFVTLLVSKQQNKKVLESEHIEILNNQLQTTRLSIMPIFDVTEISGKKEKQYKGELARAIHIIEIKIKNVGNGVAMNTYLKWGTSTCELEYHPVYEDENARYTCYKEFSYDNTIATVGKEINVFLIRKNKNDKKVFKNAMILPVCFFDILYNHYEQKIIINYNITNEATGEIKAFEITPLTPNLLEKNEDE